MTQHSVTVNYQDQLVAAVVHSQQQTHRRIYTVTQQQTCVTWTQVCCPRLKRVCQLHQMKKLISGANAGWLTAEKKSHLYLWWPPATSITEETNVSVVVELQLQKSFPSDNIQNHYQNFGTQTSSGFYSISRIIQIVFSRSLNLRQWGCFYLIC